MNTLQGVISKAINNATTQFEALGYVSTNVANFNTTGYKGVRFENYLQEYGRIDGVVRYDYSSGILQNTHNPLDVAIDGPGFIPVTGKDGTVAYTRDGSFQVNTEGYMVTNDNFIVGDGIKIPHQYERLKITPDGTITAVVKKDEEPITLGKIPVVNFYNPEGLKSIEGNKLVATSESGKPILMKNQNSIKQSCIERSNVNLFSSVNEVLRLNASIIATTRIMKVVDDIYRQSINLRQ